MLRNSRRFVYDRLLSPGNLFVNDHCTDYILIIFVTVYGDHTGLAYSNNDLTQVVNALSSVARCLEWKHLKIRLALVRTFFTTVLIRCDMVSSLSIKMLKSRISETRLTVTVTACLIT